MITPIRGRISGRSPDGGHRHRRCARQERTPGLNRRYIWGPTMPGDTLRRAADAIRDGYPNG
jgi:hypothetical protein